MKELPDLSRTMAARTSPKKGGSGGEVNPPSPRRNVTVPAADARTPKEDTSKKVTSKKKKKKQGPEALEERHGEGPSEQAHTGDGSKKDPEEPSSEEVPLKKRRKKKETGAPRPSSVYEDELWVLVPDVAFEGRTSGDDENQTIAARIGSRERRLLDEDPPEVAADYQRISENPIDSPIPGERHDRQSEENLSLAPEGSETRVPGRPRETPEDNIRFEFNRELPLSFYPEECGRLIRSVKGGPNPLPPVGGLIFEEEYGHAACSSVKKYDAALKSAREQILAGEEEQRRIKVAHEEALQVAIREKEEAVAHEKALRREFNETRSSDLAELESCKDSMKNLEFVVDKLGKEKADLERARAADSMKHAKEANRLRKSRKYEVTHERVRVMIAMISKAERCFNRIRLRETKRDAYDEAWCLYSQAFGTRACLEQIRDSGVEIPPDTIAAFAEQEKFFGVEAARLEVKEIPEDDLRLFPLVLKSQFIVEDVWARVNPYGSNLELLDSEVAIALRTPHNDQVPRSEALVKEVVRSAGSSTRRAGSESVHADQALPTKAPGADQVEAPVIVLSDSPSKFLKAAGLVGYSSEDSETESEDSGPKDQGRPAMGDTPPAATFGRVSGPEQSDNGGRKDPPSR
ncbi:hypothetical protein Bca4012_084497 [Brassica carinata]